MGVQGRRTACAGQLLALLLLVQQLCMIHSVTGSRARPGALAPGRWLQEGARHTVSLGDLPALLPTQALPALPRARAGRRYPGVFFNCTRSSVGCHNKNFFWLGILKERKSLDQETNAMRVGATRYCESSPPEITAMQEKCTSPAARRKLH